MTTALRADWYISTPPGKHKATDVIVHVAVKVYFPYPFQNTPTGFSHPQARMRDLVSVSDSLGFLINPNFITPA